MLKELRRKLDKKEISAPELCGEYLRKIKSSDREINSYITVCDTADAAEKAQKDINSGRSLPLSGIPVSIKDNICTKGIKTTCASKMLADFVPIYNASAVDSLEKNGAVILGKTNMDEFAMGSKGDSSFFGAVHNPHNTAYTAGGSSAGAAAAVAAGFCAAALGSDTGGSVRLPAACCGVTGLKPTYGSVSRYGLIAFASSLDQIGIIAESAEDTGYILSIIAGKDEKDPTSSELSGGDYLALIGKSLNGLKIGIPKECFTDEVSEEIRIACMSAAEFYKSCGFEIVGVSMPSLEYAVSAYYLLSSAEAASNLSRYDGVKFGYCTDKKTDFSDILTNSRSEAFGDEVKRRIMLGNYALSAGYYDMYYKNAQRAKNAICSEYEDIFSKCDLILSPTSPKLPGRLGEKAAPSEVYKSDIYTVPASIAGLPAINTVCGYSKGGMPIGMSLTGRAFDERTIIAAADLFEKSFLRQEAVI